MSAYHNDLTGRGQRILERVATQPHSLYACHAVLALTGDAARVEDIVCSVFGAEQGGPFGRIAAGTFDVFAAMHLASRWRDRLTPKTLDHIRRVVTRGVHHRGNTENHWLMYYVGNLLAVDLWPDEPVWWNGLPPQVMREEATRWLLGTIDRTARTGHHEYDSTQYHGWHVTPMIALADHATNAHLRAQAEKTATLLIADMAIEYFHGAWAGGHSREGYCENTWHGIGTSAALGYYYFGADPDAPLSIQPGMCPAVTAHYKPPEILAKIACDRTRPHAVKKTKAPRTIFRHTDREARPVRKYTYISPSFALGTTQTGLPGAPSGPIDLVSWDLTWHAPKHEGKVVCNHPYLNPGRFSAFLTEVPQSIGRSVAAPKPYLQNPDRLFGASPYEQIMQHKGAALVLYRIPEGDETPYVNLFLPRSVAWTERNNWILGDCNGFFAALRPIGPYRWQAIDEDDHVKGWLLRIQGHNIGLALEAVETADVPSFDAFCNAMTDDRLGLHAWQTHGIVAYNALNGHHLQFTYDGDHRVDGVPIDYTTWPLYDSPNAHASTNTGIITMHHGNDELTLDFNVTPSTPLIPMRVIG